MPDSITLHEAWGLACRLRAELDMPARATNESVAAEWAAVDALLLEIGVENRRPDSYGNTPAGWCWWVGQHLNGFVTGRWAAVQAEVAIDLSLHGMERGPLRWLVRDPDLEVHRRYFPKPSTPTTSYVFPLTDGPIPPAAPLPVEVTLFDLLGDEWAVASA